HAQEALQLVMGAALMLLVAAFIEAFWSSSGFTPEVKYGVAAILWLWVILYLVFMGRGQGGSH
ncbi:MAG: stage II sporulation protein M, partial [Candidatus Thiodiazotropha sp. (ex Notomyrtea botanica)]|nr:stage II sporulation protein M [Candidatus Thiodiazotropha sp. (ex Notomyrtea botanica)]